MGPGRAIRSYALVPPAYRFYPWAATAYTYSHHTYYHTMENFIFFCSAYAAIYALVLAGIDAVHTLCYAPDPAPWRVALAALYFICLLATIVYFSYLAIR